MGLGWPWWRAWVPVGAVVTRLFAWQAWHLVTSTFTLGGKRGTGLALAARLGPGWRVSQAWHLATSTFTLRGRRATWRHLLAPHMAGVALVALGCLWWRAWVPFGAVVAAAVSVAGGHRPSLMRGRGGSYGTGLALVARLGPRWRRCRGEALGDIDLRFAWQGLHLVTSTFAVVLGDMTFTLRGRRGAW